MIQFYELYKIFSNICLIADVTSTDVTALGGGDYIPVTTTLDFTVSDTVAVEIAIIDNDAAQDTHCFTLSLSNPNPTDGIVGADTEVCIIDNEGEHTFYNYLLFF